MVLGPSRFGSVTSAAARIVPFALAASLVYFLWRGVWRGAELSFDLKYGYASVQALLHGLDPYDPGHLRQVLLAGGGTLDNIVGELRNVYFPATIPVFAPISLGSWQLAHMAWLALEVLLVFAIIVGTLRYLGWPLLALRSLAFAAAVLALAPIHTTIADGQTGVAAVAALVGALLLQRGRRGVASGALYGLSTAIKVQVGLFFVGLQLLRGRWSSVAAALAVVALLTLIAVVPMQLAGHPWFEGWQANVAWSLAPGGINSPDPGNPARVTLVNLQYPLQQLGAGETLADLLTFGVVGAMGLLYLAITRRPDRRSDLLDVSVIAVLALLVTYHRFYDAVLLVFPVAWAFRSWHDGRRVVAALALLCCADFVFPFQAALSVAADGGSVPAWLADSVAWRALALGQHVWALLALAVVLLVAAWQGSPSPQARPVAVPGGVR